MKKKETSYFLTLPPAFCMCRQNGNVHPRIRRWLETNPNHVLSFVGVLKYTLNMPGELGRHPQRTQTNGSEFVQRITRFPRPRFFPPRSPQPPAASFQRPQPELRPFPLPAVRPHQTPPRRLLPPPDRSPTDRPRVAPTVSRSCRWHLGWQVLLLSRSLLLSAPNEEVQGVERTTKATLVTESLHDRK